MENKYHNFESLLALVPGKNSFCRHLVTTALWKIGEGEGRAATKQVNRVAGENTQDDDDDDDGDDDGDDDDDDDDADDADAADADDDDDDDADADADADDDDDDDANNNG